MKKTVFFCAMAVILFTSCISRKQIKAALWLNNGLPKSMCGNSKPESEFPELWDYGFYRRLNNGKFEFISYCNPIAREWFSVHRDDLERILDANLPEP